MPTTTARTLFRGDNARTAGTEHAMLADWTALPDDLQLDLAHNAMRHAAGVIAEQAEALALAIEGGTLADRGGPEALRLLAAVIRVAGRDNLPAGHC